MTTGAYSVDFKSTSSCTIGGMPLTAPVNATGARSHSLFVRPYLPLALGAVALVTLAAMENRAVLTALPTMVRELSAMGSFGLINAAPIAAFVVSLAVAGLWADRSGPVPLLRVGVTAFAVAQLFIGTASAVPMVVAGRVLSGLAEGLIDVGLMVLVARALPAALRPRIFALLSAAWVLPSVLGPVVTGVVTEQVGWRWVFLGGLVLVPPTWLLLRPAMRLAQARTAMEGQPSIGATATGATGPGVRWSLVPWAVAGSVAVFSLSLAGERLADRTAEAALVIVAGGALALVSAAYLLPRGTLLARRGMPAVIATRGLVAAAFGAGAWLPLLLTVVHGFRPALTGISLSITGVMWAFGSWLQARPHGLARVTVLRAGLLAMATGLAFTSLLAWTELPVAVGLAGWAVAGLGMGLTSPSLSILVLDGSDTTNQGRNSSAAQLSASMSTAVAFAVGGTAVAFAAPEPGRVVFGAIITASAVLAATAAVVSRRAEVRSRAT